MYPALYSIAVVATPQELCLRRAIPWNAVCTIDSSRIAPWEDDAVSLQELSTFTGRRTLGKSFLLCQPDTEAIEVFLCTASGIFWPWCQSLTSHRNYIFMVRMGPVINHISSLGSRYSLAFLSKVKPLIHSLACPTKGARQGEDSGKQCYIYSSGHVRDKRRATSASLRGICGVILLPPRASKRWEAGVRAGPVFAWDQEQ